MHAGALEAGFVLHGPRFGVQVFGVYLDKAAEQTLLGYKAAIPISGLGGEIFGKCYATRGQSSETSSSCHWPERRG